MFVRLESGHEPVREFLHDLGRPDMTIIGSDLKKVEIGWPIGMPLCRPLGDGLWELRSKISNGRAARFLFCIHLDCICLLHGFIKKTKATPKLDLDLARRRRAALTQRG
jgi:phage-related protein